MPSNIDLSIIIVNYKSAKKTEACLDALEQSDFGVLKVETVVIENNSGDDLTELVSRYPHTRLIASPKNLGMGGGNNLGIRNSSGNVILVLNPDTRPAPLAVKELFSYLKENPDVGLVGPKLLNPDGSLQNSCARFPNFWLPILRRTFLGNRFASVRNHLMMEDFDYRCSCPVDWLMGSCLMFRRQLNLPSGPKTLFFDDQYFMYFEDVDLCRQVWENGYKVCFVHTAEVIHDHSRGSARYPWYFAPFRDRLTRTHIISWFKYFLKWGFKPYICQK